MTKKNVKKAKEESDGLATAEPEPAEDLFEEENSDKKKKKKKKKGKDDDANEASETVEKVEEVDEDQDDKKNKKAKKKEKVDPKKDKKGGPGKKAIAAMQETLRKIKEEEDRIRREEEEAERKAEEEERIRLEQERKEQERRDLKKQREKEKRDRLKAEGKFLTPKQRAAQARSQASLEILRAQGVDVPLIGEKRPRAGTRVRTNKQQQAVVQTDESTTSEENKAEQKPDGETEVLVEEEEEEVKESWDAESSSEEEVEEEPVPTTTAETTHSKSKSESEDSDDSDEEDDSDDSSDSDNEDGKKTDALSRRERALNRIQKRRDEAEKNTDPEVLRAPVVCVLGHVDTGKTKILDKLRRTHVQDGEAGGITQQIGATNVPIEAIREQSKMVIGFQDMKLKIPGLLIIDTPGHESFSNLRSRGSSLCDIAILVVDIMHGLEPQTIESLNLLKAKKTPFVVALNKIDRLYDWISNPKKDVKDLIKSQAKNTQLEFQDRAKLVITQLAEQSMNAAVFYENPDSRSYVSMVPTSAATGDGMGNLMSLIVELTQTALAKRLMYTDELQATVLEVKAIPGYGTTVDIILINGTLHESDTIVLAGTDGPIVTQIRSLLLPQPMKELRVKNTYTEPKEVRAAQGVKITAKDLEKAIAGLNLLVAYHPDEVEICKEEVAHELKSALGRIKLQDRGVYVQASTLGSLEALLEFLKTSEIPYANIRIGPVVKKDVMKASTMLEHNAQYAVILAFDVKIERDAQEMADSVGVKIFQADIIYHLFDSFMKYRDELKAKKREEFKDVAVFPCKLRILPQFIFNTRDPIVVGVVVENGIVKEGTPLCVPTKEFVCIGIVTNIEVNHKAIETARKGQEVCIKISPTPGDSPKLYGRHFDHTDLLVSKISRESIDACKEYFRDDLQKPDWQLMVELKKLFQIL
ncbi:eukaryotic translation initiation factor 5B-like [Daphnia pulex]|uniref:eukaryotic translation initiation factor 5B-like n=1 Tax=Daphnia pulex TaxID=6669 RepID=UPI001EDE938A|nr:eukaryotic translation initiation factor 5B-like [Daphnia pulex]XP_046461825.1 eukaryotic translation initiation factor 5B-like [Daphnia pulex]